MVVRASVQPGQLVGGRYALEARIGEGGMGEVWRARHVALESHVAIKLLQLASAENESALRRFTAEARITAQLKSPHAVQVFDFGVTDDRHPYLVMELLDGETVGRRLARTKRLGLAETARLLGQAARALQRGHQLGIVHRDFKPDNIIVCVDDEGRDHAKVLDFGVAKLVGVLEPSGDRRPASPDGAHGSFTRTGTILGTPLYMAPEQVRDSAAVDARTDLWALGVVAFECLTGRTPYTGATLAELFERIQTGLHPAATLLEPSLPPAFDAWFDRACALDPAKRFADAAQAFKQLADALNAPAAAAPPGRARVLVVPATDRPDAVAPTVAVRPAHPKREVAPALEPDTRALVRARHLKDWLTYAAADEDPWRARFFGSIPPDVRETIESATSGSWLPAKLHVQLADLMQDAYGPARAHEHYRRSFAVSVRGGIVGPLVQAGVRLFGMSPATFLRWASRGWETSFRHCGMVEGQVLGPGRGRMVYTALPAFCTESDAWLGSAQGSAYGAYDVCGVSGVVRIDKSGRAENRWCLALEWTER